MGGFGSSSVGPIGPLEEWEVFERRPEPARAAAPVPTEAEVAARGAQLKLRGDTVLTVRRQILASFVARRNEQFDHELERRGMVSSFLTRSSRTHVFSLIHRTTTVPAEDCQRIADACALEQQSAFTPLEETSFDEWVARMRDEGISTEEYIHGHSPRDLIFQDSPRNRRDTIGNLLDRTFLERGDVSSADLLYARTEVRRRNPSLNTLVTTDEMRELNDAWGKSSTFERQDAIRRVTGWILAKRHR